MSAQEPENESPSTSSVSEEEQGSHEEAPDGGGEVEEGSVERLNEMLGELRAEVTRLKAHRAKEQAQNWIERHPLLAVVLSAGVGAAAGYTGARLSRPSTPTLSEHARRRLGELVDEARRAASDVSRDLSARASESGKEVRQRAEQTGRRVAKEARKAGASAQREAGSFAQRVGAQAGETLRRATTEASRRFQEGREAAQKGARDLGETIEEKAADAIRQKGDAVKEAVSESGDSRKAKRTLWTIFGLAAGGYLAALVRRWL